MNGWRLDQAVRRLDINSTGKDFVIGDIHGCFNLLEQALQAVNFDPTRDRLLSVGDLIDRGDQSIELLTLLEKPWFFACLGNHESVLLDYVHSRDTQAGINWRRFGGAWFFDLSATQQNDLADSIRQHCSFLIEVNDGEKAVFGVVHADVPEGMSWQHFTEVVGSDKTAQHDCLWNRERGIGLRDGLILGVEQVVCGHEIVQTARKVGNVWLIDTGAYRASSGAGKLSILELPETIHTFS